MKTLRIQPLENEDGTIMVIALLIMAILTILGISAIDTSTIEVQIASNERIYKQNFYQAEAAVIAAAQRMENMTAGQLYNITDDAWINTTSLNTANLVVRDPSDTATPPAWLPIWEDIEDASSPGSTDPRFLNARYTVVETTGFGGVLTDEKTMHEYRIFGVYDSPVGRNRGRVVVEIGYKKKF